MTLHDSIPARETHCEKYTPQLPDADGKSDWPDADTLIGEGYDRSAIARLPRDHRGEGGRVIWDRRELPDLLVMVADRRQP